MRPAVYLLTSSWGMCAGIAVLNGVVIEAAPILSYMRAWPLARVMRYSAQRAFTVEFTG